MKITPDDISMVFTNAAGDAVAEVKNGRIVPALTIAQSIRRSSDPYRAAITSFTSRDIIRSEDGQKDKKIFHFEDASFLTFEVSYLAVEDGGGQ